MSSSSRREFLSGDALRSQVAEAGSQLADAVLAADSERTAPIVGTTVRLTTRAMACDFAVVLNERSDQELRFASEALEYVHPLEEQLSAYRESSELTQLNRNAAANPAQVEQGLFKLLQLAVRLSRETNGGFDPTSGPLIALWRNCRKEGRIPTQDEVDKSLQQCGIEGIVFDDAAETVSFEREGLELNLGGIGKGYALDRIGDELLQSGVNDWLLHGGHSSLLAHGVHNQLTGWPVGIRNPLFPDQRMATIVLKNEALSSSGSGTQHFRHAGKRYGHILDPRSGWPVDGMLSVTVLAPTAAEADALSTAFFVIGVENARQYCDNHPKVAALLVPNPQSGRKLEPINCGIPDEKLFLFPDGGDAV